MTDPRCTTLVVTTGEPAGVGPDILLQAAQHPWDCRLAIAADPELLRSRAALLGLQVELVPWRAQPHRPGTLAVLEVGSSMTPVAPGQPDPNNARYVLDTLDRAIDGCLSGEFDALVTGPVHKATINEAGYSFSGHTEYLASRTATPLPVMLLTADTLRVALVTTHVPIQQVAGLITRERVTQALQVLLHDLERKFGLPKPRVAVCGLNPHAGEGGHLGREDHDAIAPAIAALRRLDHRVTGPVAADTAFTRQALARCDAVLAMYHDQGLPVVKQQGFGRAVNVTLGLPLLRTSVDHGTGLRLAGSGQAHAGSLIAALRLADRLVRQTSSSTAA